MSWIEQRPDDAMDGGIGAVSLGEFVRTVEPARFREAMSRLGAAVHVITTAGPAGRTGLTATAVCSVSDQPPTLLVCINRRAQSAAAIAENGVFCVNTLQAAQTSIADFFAQRGANKADAFAGGDWTTLETGSPSLASAVVTFDCKIIEQKSVASHNVIFGAVVALHMGPAVPALVYHERVYKQV